MANGLGSNPQPAAPSAPQSPTGSSEVLKPAEPLCRRCWWLNAKRRLGCNGDWLFVTFDGDCAQCAAKKQPQYHDLDLDYDSSGAANAAFSTVTDAEAVSSLLDHAKEYYEGAIETQGIVRDKAKLLLGATSFTIGVFALAATVLKDALPNMPIWMVIVALVSLVLPASHFVRALFYAIVAITRESTCAVSTQEVVAILSGRDGAYEKSRAERQLAASYRMAATTTNQWVREPKSKVMLAQGCFKWGLLLLPILVLEYLVLVYVVGSSTIPRWAAPVVADNKAVQARLDAVDARIATVETRTSGFDKAAVDRRLRELERRLDDHTTEAKGLVSMMHTLRTDFTSLRDQTTSSRTSVATDLQSITDRAKAIEDRLDTIVKRVESLAKDSKALPQPSKTDK